MTYNNLVNYTFVRRVEAFIFFYLVDPVNACLKD